MLWGYLMVARSGGSREIHQCPLRLGERDWLADFIVMKLSPGDDVILGMDWMRRYKVVLDMHRGTFTVTADDGIEHVCMREDREEPDQ